jgi:monoamine oxidase
MLQRSADVIVIGGGVAGLAAAGELGREGLRVILLEARDQLGGRIFTARRRGWPEPIELGAQFVHGGNDALKKLMQRHGIAKTKVPGLHWRYPPTGLERIDDVEKRIAAVTKQIDAKRMRGWSFADFMRAKGKQFEVRDRDLAIGFVEGFEAAPMDEMSAVALKGETLDDDEQSTVVGGYDRVVDALVAELSERVQVIRNAICATVRWHKGRVEVQTTAGLFVGETAIVSVPLSVLQARPPARGALRFDPPLRHHAAVVAKMGMGHVLRATARFDGRSWRKLLPEKMAAERGGFGFVHSRLERIPVWWSLSQHAEMTAWAGGPAAQRLTKLDEASLRRVVVEALASVLGATARNVAAALRDLATHNWSRDPFSRGAYSFTRAGQDAAAEKLRQPVEDTLFFAGEATADGEEVGTVHGALASGGRAAIEVLAALGQR